MSVQSSVFMIVKYTEFNFNDPGTKGHYIKNNLLNLNIL